MVTMVMLAVIESPEKIRYQDVNGVIRGDSLFEH